MTGDASHQPLYEHVKQSLREAIGRNEYQSGQPFITQRTVCERFGVSSTTAVRALNELVAEGVLVRRRGLGTFVAERRPASPGDAAAGSDRIACILHGLEGKHVSRVLHGIEAACVDHGYQMFLSHTQASRELEVAALRRALAAGVAGVILYPAEGGPEPGVLGELRRRRMPLVMVDRYRPDVPTDAVLADNFAVGEELTERLIADGHSRIATLWSETDCTSVADRLAGHKRALTRNGIPVRPDLAALRSYIGQPEAARRGLLESLLEGPQPPTALLCANGYVLAAAAADLLALGRRIPDDVDLAGMDDAGPYDLLPLASIAAVLPSEEMGTAAMRLLVERIGSDDPYRDTHHTVLPVSLRDRASARLQLRAAPSRTA